VLGYILDQDMSNLVEVQKGLKAAKPARAFMTLGRYQECNIQHFHNVYAQALGLPEAERLRQPCGAGATAPAER
jgi:hypothetical protein